MTMRVIYNTTVNISGTTVGFETTTKDYATQ